QSHPRTLALARQSLPLTPASPLRCPRPYPRWRRLSAPSLKRQPNREPGRSTARLSIQEASCFALRRHSSLALKGQDAAVEEGAHVGEPLVQHIAHGRAPIDFLPQDRLAVGTTLGTVGDFLVVCQLTLNCPAYLTQTAQCLILPGQRLQAICRSANLRLQSGKLPGAPGI